MDSFLELVDKLGLSVHFLQRFFVKVFRECDLLQYFVFEFLSESKLLLGDLRKQLFLLDFVFLQ